MQADRATLDLRLRLGADALFSIDEAALLLPVPLELGREWIAAKVKQVRIAGVASVRWADVLRAVEAGEDAGGSGPPPDVQAETPASRWLSTQDAAEVLGVSRATVDRAIARLPAHRRPAQLPSRGQGARVRYGWVGEDALRAWWKGVTAEKALPPKPAPRRKTAPSTEGVVDWGSVVREARSKARA